MKMLLHVLMTLALSVGISAAPASDALDTLGGTDFWQNAPRYIRAIEEHTDDVETLHSAIKEYMSRKNDRVIIGSDEGETPGAHGANVLV